jgi:hypothetical protein
LSKTVSTLSNEAKALTNAVSSKKNIVESSSNIFKSSSNIIIIIIRNKKLATTLLKVILKIQSHHTFMKK